MYSVKEEKQQEKRPESGLRAQGWVGSDCGTTKEDNSSSNSQVKRLKIWGKGSK